MPYKSIKQERWAHTSEGEKALGGQKKVHEWDEATKGMNLPEKVEHKADGGEAGNESAPDDGSFLSDLANLSSSLAGKVGPALQGLREVPPAVETLLGVPSALRAGTGYYTEPDVTTDSNPATPPATAWSAAPAGTSRPSDGNAISSMLTAAHNAPDTDYSNLNGQSAQDILNKYANLLKAQTSAPNLIAEGAAGLGDALARSYGRENTNFMGNIQAQNQQNDKNAMNLMTTGLQLSMEDEMYDPNSALSRNAAGMLRAAGLNVPQGTTFFAIKQIAPSIADLSLKQAELASMNQYRNAEVANQAVAQRANAAARADQLGLLGKYFTHPEEYKVLQQIAGSGAQNPTPNPGMKAGWRVVR